MTTRFTAPHCSAAPDHGRVGVLLGGPCSEGAGADGSLAVEWEDGGVLAGSVSRTVAAGDVAVPGGVAGVETAGVVATAGGAVGAGAAGGTAVVAGVVAAGVAGGVDSGGSVVAAERETTVPGAPVETPPDTGMLGAVDPSVVTDAATAAGSTGGAPVAGGSNATAWGPRAGAGTLGLFSTDPTPGSPTCGTQETPSSEKASPPM